MSPPASRDLNGARPAPLKIHKDSHFINKTSSSSSSSTTGGIATSNHQQQQQQQQRHHPVIIYTHSPKVIHTQACDFMALVQKLTGLSRSPDEDINDNNSSSVNNNPPPPPPPPPQPPSRASFKPRSATVVPQEESSTSSSDNCTSVASDMHGSCSSLTTAPIGFDLPNPFLTSEIPTLSTFTAPNAGGSEFFCSPSSLYRYPDASVFSSSMQANMQQGGTISSSSFMDVMKAYNEF